MEIQRTMGIRTDRSAARLVKAAILFGAFGLMIEGLFEFKLLVQPLVAPPSVPGQSKIIEHFAIQHVAFPIIGVLLVFAPLRLRRLVASRLAMCLLGTLGLLATLPEAIVSRTDLFRPYPFELHNPMLKAVQMVDLGFVSINTLQMQHLLFAHFTLMGTIAVLAFFNGFGLLSWFAGPRTGELVAATSRS
jgi:hypothetical protein